MKRDQGRLLTIFAIFTVFYLVILMKLFYWQVVMADNLRKAGRAQSSLSLVTTAKRGDILFNDGFPVATNKVSYLLFANPKKVESTDNYANLLSPILSVDAASISARLSQNLYWVSLQSRLSYDQKTQIEGLKLGALGFEQQTERNYPEASMAAHLVGFVGKNQDGEDQGYFGLEGYYDRQLRGRPGSTYLIKDALGNPILTDVREDKKIDGRNLITTVERSVQYVVDTDLRRGIEQYQAEGGSVIVMETKTGKILAASSYPKFDPQKYWEFDGSTYTNPIISSLYEPGSTFKVLVMAAGIDSGLVTPDTKCDNCAGPVEIGGYSIKTWNDQYFPNITMNEVIQHSDNTGMVFVAKRLGLTRFLSYIKKFGFGNITGIDIQGEVTETLRPLKKWHEIDLATASFGQGISVTPIQLITAVNAIANGGKLMKPMVVDKIITPDNRTIQIKPQEEGQVISSATAKVVTWMMVNAVEKGEAKFAKIPNYNIAGKTGTAQIPVEGHYDPTNTNASFIGFFPAEDPKITMLVVINKPHSSIYGAETAAPTFFSIARDLIQKYNIEPSK
jgi:cell division protein FtsI/penicillin-binding protein 2